MEVNFKYADYICEYYGGKIHFSQAICFSAGFGSSYKNYVNCSYILYKKQRQLNKTFFSSKELLDVLTILSKELKFTLMSINEDVDKFRVQIRMISNKRWNLFVSTFIRYLFEFPMSLAIYCAYKNRDKYKNIRFTTLVQFCLATTIHINSVHCISRPDWIIKNVSPKVLFNAQLHDFNIIVEPFRVVCDRHEEYDKKNQIFELDNLPKLVREITSTIDSYYKKYEKDICSWK